MFIVHVLNVFMGKNYVMGIACSATIVVLMYKVSSSERKGSVIYMKLSRMSKAVGNLKVFSHISQRYFSDPSLYLWYFQVIRSAQVYA